MPKIEDDPNVVYIRNASGGVTSVTPQHYNTYLTVRSESGQVFPKPGYEVLTAAQAKAANPQLFGVADPRVVYTREELATRLRMEKDIKELQALNAENNA